MKQEDFIMIMVTVGKEEEATEIARLLVGTKLAACVNIVPGIRSIYRWKGEICDDPEILCIIKTRNVLLQQVMEAVKNIHSYEVPEIISLRIDEGSDDYLQWLATETS